MNQHLKVLALKSVQWKSLFQVYAYEVNKLKSSLKKNQITTYRDDAQLLTFKEQWSVPESDDPRQEKINFFLEFAEERAVVAPTPCIVAAIHCSTINIKHQYHQRKKSNLCFCLVKL